MADSFNPYAVTDAPSPIQANHSPTLGTQVEDGPWVQFDLAADDIAELNLHLMGRSRLRRGQNRTWWLGFGAVALPLLLMTLLPRIPWGLFLICASFVALLIANRLLYKTVVRRNIGKLLSEDDNQNLLGIQELQRTDEAIFHRAAVCESRYTPSAFVRIDETPTHWFLFTSSLHAITVPKESITGGDLAATIAAIQAA